MKLARIKRVMAVAQERERERTSPDGRTGRTLTWDTILKYVVKGLGAGIGLPPLPLLRGRVGAAASAVSPSLTSSTLRPASGPQAA
jgi:hypothetical protein